MSGCVKKAAGVPVTLKPMTTDMISVDEALALIAENANALPAETLAIGDAIGRYAAASVAAQITNLPYRASAMDGYAVRFEDANESGQSLTVIGEAPAGAPFDGAIGEGEAVRIFTGGIVPDGADHVIIQEDVSRNGDTITVTDQQKAPGNIRAPGQDFQTGDPLINAGEIVTPLRAALIASGNVAELSMTKRPLIYFFGNGDELRTPGSQDIAPGQVISSTPFGLSGLIERFGGHSTYGGVATDTLDSVGAMIDAAMSAGANVITPLGGASVGDYDLVRPAFEKRGFEIIFHKIAVKPGKPTWLAKKGDTLALGLPGNPGSAFACAHLFLAPLIRQLAGANDPSNTFPAAKLAGPLQANGGRAHYLRAHYDIDDEGTLRVAPFAKQDSSLLMPFARANCLLKREANASAAGEGDVVEVLVV